MSHVFHRTCGKESVRKAALLLPISPTASSSLLVDSRVPIGIKEDEPITTNEIQSTVMARVKQSEFRVTVYYPT
jgi:hypothetical protein